MTTGGKGHGSEGDGLRQHRAESLQASQAKPDMRVFIEGRRLTHEREHEPECVATPPMPACPCGAFTHLEWSWTHL